MKHVLILSAVVLLSGCCSSDRAFVLTVDSTYDWLIPEYRAYIQNDAKLSPDDVRIRERAIGTLEEATDAKKRELQLGL